MTAGPDGVRRRRSRAESRPPTSARPASGRWRSTSFPCIRSERRVVITGLGLVSPLGIGPDAVWSALAEGRGGVGTLRPFPVDGLPTDVGGEVTGSTPRPSALPKHKKALGKSLKYMARDIQLAVAAAQLAVADAGLADGGVDPTRIGVDLGAGLISTELDELAPAIDLASGRRRRSTTTPGAARAIPHDPADLAAEVPAEHARLPHLDPARLPGAEQHDHRGRGRRRTSRSARPAGSSPGAGPT